MVIVVSSSDEVDDRLLRARVVNDANQLVIDHDAFGNAEKIGRLADLVERTHLPNAPGLRCLVVEGLRARAAMVASAKSGL